MRIVHVSAEFAPIAKAGGLGEVLVGLARECTKQKENVEVILPKYSSIDMGKLSSVKMEVPDFKCWEKGNLQPNAVWSATCEEVTLKLIDVRHPSGYFHRGQIYGCQDDVARFLYFSRAVCEYLKLRSEKIDVLHLHDWHVAPIALLARDLFNLPIGAIVLTIHNAEYQGQCAHWDLDAIGLNGLKYQTKELLQDPLHPESLNLLKGGIVYANWVTTVSPTYAKELLTVELGGNLQPTFFKYRKKFSGILNGLDLTLWDPGYKKGDRIETIYVVKKKAKEKLCKQFALVPTSNPWVGSITRLVFQKGPELIEETLCETVRQKGTFILLASPSTPEYQLHFEKLKKRFEPTGYARLILEYDEETAHLLYTALDFLILPSRYEPCGLAQMIAMRHGTIPIARATGGHKDTIVDGKTGFLFPDYTSASLSAALQKGIQEYRTHPDVIEKMILQGIAIDWSWKKPAQEYLNLYKKLI
ncbi:MAG TPA: glycogen/starch synthase [Chlamydiales bacterium]|nr:glycogen/starch synthase [Chlamydiales bacterium]